jgi:adenine-specific DNA-methyltransferase
MSLEETAGTVHAPETDRKAKGAFFTPRSIATFLVGWAIAGNRNARVLDPMCGDGVFLQAAAEVLRRYRPDRATAESVHGIDMDEGALSDARSRLEAHGLRATLTHANFYSVDAPDGLLSTFNPFDAVVGNPPFVRYQMHSGGMRKLSVQAAFRQGVALSGLASSWAAALVHAAAFLAPSGRLAMVLPAELLTVGYAEPVRRWLKSRFGAVRLVLFEKLQFEDATENVVLLLANGSGGCDGFSIYHVESAKDLPDIPLTEVTFTPQHGEGWNHLLLSHADRAALRSGVKRGFHPLGQYGAIELGTVTGGNDFFTLTEEARVRAGIAERHLRPIVPAGARHLLGSTFTTADWRRLKSSGERVWLLYPDLDHRDPSVTAYLDEGVAREADRTYKSRKREPWWKPPVVPPPDMFFTYMSHRFPRLVTNSAGVSMLNSLHGLRLRDRQSRKLRRALPLLSLNSLTLLGAETYGRSYGGGILKMEPREASVLPVPAPDLLADVWPYFTRDLDRLERQLRNGLWTSVVARVDRTMLREAGGMPADELELIQQASQRLRARRHARRSGG